MDVLFELPSKGKHFTIEVGFFDTVHEIKEKIQKYKGFQVSRQTLIFNGQTMIDEHDTEFYEVLHWSCIQLQIKPDSAEEEEQQPQSPGGGGGSMALSSDEVEVDSFVGIEWCWSKDSRGDNSADNDGELWKELQKLQEQQQPGHILHYLPAEGYF